MRNLKLTTEHSATVTLGALPSVSLQAVVTHDLSDRVFVAHVEPLPADKGSGSGSAVFVSCVLSDGSVAWRVDVTSVTSVTSVLGDECSGSVPFGFDAAARCCLAMDVNADALSVGLSSGHIMSLSPIDGHLPPRLEELGTIEGGVASLTYSPDGELLCVVTVRRLAFGYWGICSWLGARGSRRSSALLGAPRRSSTLLTRPLTRASFLFFFFSSRVMDRFY